MGWNVSFSDDLVEPNKHPFPFFLVAWSRQHLKQQHFAAKSTYSSGIGAFTCGDEVNLQKEIPVEFIFGELFDQ